MVDISEAMDDAQVLTEFGQLKTIELQVIIGDDNPGEAKAINNGLPDEVLHLMMGTSSQP